MKQKMFIFGSSSFAEIAAAYFTRSNQFQVLGHIVDSNFKTADSIGSLPVYASGTFEANELINECTYFYVASTYTELNRFRARKYFEFKSIGLMPASYVSPDAFVDPTVTLGEHVFIFENNVIQFGTRIHSNSVLWSGNHIGHHSVIEDNVFISSHVVVSGHCRVGKNTFLGVNATVYNNVDIGEDNWIGPNSVVSKSTSRNVMMRAEPTKASQLETTKFFRIVE